MKIISPYKDYYDYYMGYGQDPLCVYKRIPQSILDEWKPKYGDHYSEKAHTGSFDTEKGQTIFMFKISVAGKVFSHYVENFTIGSKTYRKYSNSLSEMLGNRSLVSRYFNDSTYKHCSGEFVKHYKDIHDVCGAPIILFGHENSATYVGDFKKTLDYSKHYTYNSKSYVANPTCLGEMGFENSMPANEIFYEISNFIMSNKEPAPEKIEDKYKIIGAGFDTKESFRHRK